MEEFELEPGETITRSVRKHWLFLVVMLTPYVIFAIAPLFIPLAIQFIATVSPITAAHAQASLLQGGAWDQLALAFWWLFLWIGTFTIITRYFLTLWIITSTRIVEIHQYGFFSRKVSSFLLNRVQDVTTNVEGFLPTMFNFGTIDVETAGHEQKFEMSDIENPTDLRDLIMREVAALHADGQLPTSGV